MPVLVKTKFMKLRRLFSGVAWLFVVFTSFAAPPDALEAGFSQPPDSAKPHTWWHWMNGNITKEGLTADLEAMKQIGLGGATIVNVDCGIPAGQAPFMSPAWREDFKFAVQEADRLGFKLCVENCAGWSSSGGPWNTPSNAMQCLTSSETDTDGPKVFDAVLAKPASKLGFYRDVVVLAFPVPAAAVPEASRSTAAAGKLEIKRAVYGAQDGGSSKDVTARIVALIKSGHKSVVASNDEMGGDPAFGEVKQLTVDLTLDGKPGKVTVDENDELVFPVNAAQLAEAQSHVKTSAYRTFVELPRRKSAYGSEVIQQGEIVDLTAKMSADGRGGRFRRAIGLSCGWVTRRPAYTIIRRRRREMDWNATSSASRRWMRTGTVLCRKSWMTWVRWRAKRWIVH